MKKITDFIMLLCCILMFWSLCLSIKSYFEDIKMAQTAQLQMLHNISLLQKTESKLLEVCRK